MPFQYVLANLLASSEGAIGALLIDEGGETVDLASSDLSPFDIRLIGAYLGIYLRNASKILRETELGQLRILHIERERLHLQLTTLPDGYFLVLVQRRPAPVGLARRHLRRAAEQLTAEVWQGGRP